MNTIINETKWNEYREATCLRTYDKQILFQNPLTEEDIKHYSSEVWRQRSSPIGQERKSYVDSRNPCLLNFYVYCDSSD